MERRNEERKEGRKAYECKHHAEYQVCVSLCVLHTCYYISIYYNSQFAVVVRSPLDIPLVLEGSSRRDCV